MFGCNTFKCEINKKITDITIISPTINYIDCIDPDAFTDSMLTKIPNSNIIIDLSSVEKIGSNIIGAFVAMLELLEKKGKHLILCRLKKRSKRVMQVMHIDTIIKIFDNEEDAIQSLTAKEKTL